MRAEDRPPYEQEDITEEYSFDELARGLADGTLTRGRALKYIGAALLGSLGAMAGISAVAAEADARGHRKRHRGGGHKKCPRSKFTCGNPSAGLKGCCPR